MSTLVELAGDLSGLQPASVYPPDDRTPRAYRPHDKWKLLEASIPSTATSHATHLGTTLPAGDRPLHAFKFRASPLRKHSRQTLSSASASSASTHNDPQRPRPLLYPPKLLRHSRSTDRLSKGSPFFIRRDPWFYNLAAPAPPR